jgi:integrase
MARKRKHDGGIYRRPDSAVWWMWYRDRDGRRQLESTSAEDWNEAQQRLRERLQARDQNVLLIVRKGEQIVFQDWAEFFLENYSRPPFRAEKTHSANKRAIKHLTTTFGTCKLMDLTADGIELYLRRRLRGRVPIRTLGGIVEGGELKPSTVHQEFRILRRMMNVAVRKKHVRSNPCDGVEFPMRVDGLFRPHYMPWSEQQNIEQHSPRCLRNVVRIITETGLRIYKELLPAGKDQLDLQNLIVWIPDSKTTNGRAEVPLTELAADAFRDQLEIAGPGIWLFPSDQSESGHLETLKNGWRKSLERAGVPYFRIYDLRSTYGTRLSAGGVADEWVTQMLRQGDSKVFKKYSQMKLQMKREALAKLDRRACERHLAGHSVTAAADPRDSATVLLRSEPKREIVPEDPAPKSCKIKESA